MGALFTYYHLVILVLFFVWLGVFIYLKELRTEMLTLGVMIAFLFPLMLVLGTHGEEIEFTFAKLTIADFIFAFVLAGLAGTIFHAVFGKRYHRLPYRLRRKPRDEESHAQFWFLRLFGLLFVFLWAIAFLVVTLPFSLPFATLLVSAVLAMLMVANRHDLLLDCIWSMILTTIIVFIATSFASYFVEIDFGIAPLVNDVVFLHVPLDLLIWSLAFGMALGPIYEYIRRFDLRS
ncbi:MAG: hypothetical protein WC730_02265 [Patescibacteria group bacterium]|jgi:hypothetical protein